MPKNVRERKLYLYNKLFLEDEATGMPDAGQDPAAAPPADPSGDAAAGQDPSAAPAAPAPTDPAADPAAGGDQPADPMTPPPGMKVVFVPEDVLSMYDQNVQKTGDANAGLTNPAAGAPGAIPPPVDPAAVARGSEEKEVLEAFRAWKKNKINEKAKNLYKQINEAYDEDSLVDEENEMFGSSACPSCGEPLGMKDKVCKHCGEEYK